MKGCNKHSKIGELRRREIYPGVTAEVAKPFWTPDGRLWVTAMRWHGDEQSLRRSGLLQSEDRLPKKPRGDSGLATMCMDGSFHLRLEPEEASARDVAFQCFLHAVLAPGNDGAGDHHDD